MPRAACAVIAVLCCGLPAFTYAQSQEGYVGIYADAAGTQPCAYVAPNTATSLYVIAKTAEQSTGGITGAEFRIEVSNPTNWFISYSAPMGAQALGDPIDTNPDPDAGGGVNIAFANCQQPVNGQVGLGSISVFNAGGTATNLLVKRHSVPKNANYPCPLLVLCDSPVYTKVCMGTSTEQPGCIAPQKGRRASGSEPTAFELPINPTTQPIAAGQPFSRSLTLGNSELWVMGLRVDGPTATSTYDGSVLSIAGITLPVTAIQMPERAYTDQELASTYGSVPAVQTYQGQGRTLAQAVALYEADRTALIKIADASLTESGPAAVQHTYAASPLVQRTEIRGSSGAMLYVWFKGIEGAFAVDMRTPGSIPPLDETRILEERAKNRVAAIEQAIAASPFDGSLILVSHDTMAIYSGTARPLAKAQIDHVLEGRSLSALPAGPLEASNPFLMDIIRVAKAGRKK